MDLQEYSESVVTRTKIERERDDSVEGVGVIDIATIIAIVLPILSNLPCFSERSSDDKRQWVEDHPRLAIMTAAQEIRKQARGKGDKVVRKHSKELAETIVSDYLASSDEEVDDLVG